MNIFNQIGIDIIDYKKEYLNQTYSAIVHSSIGNCIDMMLKNNEINAETHTKLKSSSISLDEFIEFISEDDKFILSAEEILKRYESIQSLVTSVLQEYLDISKINLVSNPNDESIDIEREFILSKKFLYNHFNIESDEEYEKLIERKGFIEKYAILRLSKIIEEYLSNIDRFTKDYKIFSTNIFYDAKRSIYGIYLKIIISVNSLELSADESEFVNADTARNLLEKVVELIFEAEQYFVEAGIEESKEEVEKTTEIIPPIIEDTEEENNESIDDPMILPEENLIPEIDFGNTVVEDDDL